MIKAYAPMETPRASPGHEESELERLVVSLNCWRWWLGEREVWTCLLTIAPLHSDLIVIENGRMA